MSAGDFRKCSGCDEIVYWEHVTQCERCPRYHCDRCLDSGEQIFTADGCMDCEDDKKRADELAYLRWVVETYVTIDEAELRARYMKPTHPPPAPPEERKYIDESHPEFPERLKRVREEIARQGL